MSTRYQVGICEVIFLIFFTLKLTDNLDWSWWLVFSPLIVVFILGFINVTLFSISKQLNKESKELDSQLINLLKDKTKRK